MTFDAGLTELPRGLPHACVCDLFIRRHSLKNRCPFRRGGIIERLPAYLHLGLLPEDGVSAALLLLHFFLFNQVFRCETCDGILILRV